jgi:hypothetical protein
MNAHPAPIAPRPLPAKRKDGLGGWLRGLLGRPSFRGEVIAPPQICLGGELAVAWRLDFGRQEITNVAVALVGSELARERISARTGISIVTETRAFLSLEIDRRMPEQTAGAASGRGTVVVPASTIPTVTGRLNEIEWAIVVEAAHQATLVWRNEFPLVVLPAVRP